MFGNDTTDNQTTNTTAATPTQDSTNQQAPVFGVDPITSMAPSTAPTITTDDTSLAGVASSTTPTVSTDDSLLNAASLPADLTAAPTITPAGDLTVASGDLMELKKDALAKLGPLVDKLDQSPEEKFKTTMMMIQASDDKALLPKAYEAANMIPDEKAKAQALLDIVNEINYFTSLTPGKE